MRKSRFSESQIIGILKEVESGRHVKDVCREHGISEATRHTPATRLPIVLGLWSTKSPAGFHLRGVEPGAVKRIDGERGADQNRFILPLPRPASRLSSRYASSPRSFFSIGHGAVIMMVRSTPLLGCCTLI